MVKKISQNWSTNDKFYRFPASILMLFGLVSGWLLMFQKKSATADMILFGQSLRADYLFSLTVFTVGFIIMFWPFVKKSRDIIR